MRVTDPEIGETVENRGRATGGLLAEENAHMAGATNEKASTPDQLQTLKGRTFHGREKDNAIYSVALANLMVHGMGGSHIWRDNTLTGAGTYGGLFQGAQGPFDAVLMNPPFGGKEGKDAQICFADNTSAPPVLFLRRVLDSLSASRQWGGVVDEEVLFRTNETAFV
ncbi:MAG: N-6 DNA methylase [Candidatus Oleimicrobiaceae bacterium]